MNKDITTTIGTSAYVLYLVCIASFAIGVGYHHVKLVSHDLPLDFAESSMLTVTSTIAAGINPYDLESQPSNISLYPVLYNMISAPLSLFLGNTFELHRLVSGTFILASCSLCFYLCRKSSVSRSNSFIAAVLLYAALLYYSTPIASPNSLGLFLFLAALSIPWAHKFSRGSLCISIVLGILAFYSKQYFVACLGYLALYLFIAESKRRAIYFSSTAMVAFTLVLALVYTTSPYFLDDTFFAVRSSTSLIASNDKLWKQIAEFSQIYLPILALIPLAIAYKFKSGTFRVTRTGAAKSDSKIVNLTDLDKPLFAKKANYIWFCFACSVAIIVLVLGKHRGNHLTYLFQLISPFLLVGTFALIADIPRFLWLIRILLVAALFNSYAILPTDFSIDMQNWNKIRKEISEADEIYASSLVLRELVDKGSTIYYNGHTQYFVFGRDKPPIFVKRNPEHSVPHIWKRYVSLIQSKIRNQEFDLIVIDNWMKMPISTEPTAIDTNELLKNHYVETDYIKLPLMKRPGGGMYAARIWRPAKAHSNEDQ